MGHIDGCSPFPQVQNFEAAQSWLAPGAVTIVCSKLNVGEVGLRTSPSKGNVSCCWSASNSCNTFWASKSICESSTQHQSIEVSGRVRPKPRQGPGSHSTAEAFRLRGLSSQWPWSTISSQGCRGKVLHGSEDAAMALCCIHAICLPLENSYICTFTFTCFILCKGNRVSKLRHQPLSGLSRVPAVGAYWLLANRTL